jgi:hypothetical protein
MTSEKTIRQSERNCAREGTIITHYHLQYRPLLTQVLSIIICSILLFSCSDSPAENLDTEINKALRSQNNVDEAEWKTISSLISSNAKAYPQLVDANGRVDNKKLKDYIADYAKGRRRGGDNPEIYNPAENNDSIQKPQFNFYIENSLSMDGYVKGNTDFEAAITRMLVLTKDYAGQQNLHINFINSKIYPSQEVDITNFAVKLEPKSIVYAVGGKDRGVSDLNNVFKMVLDSTGNGKIGVLISDCIYSLGKTGDTEGRLNIQKSLTMDAFLSKLRKTDISTICLKLNSSFNGTYYDLNNKPTDITGVQRPYYIWIMGSRKEIEAFYSKVDLSGMQGYTSNFVMSYSDESKAPYYTVLKETSKRGSFTPDRSSKDYVHSLTEVGYDKGNLQFAVAVDLGKLPVDSSYLLDAKNYKLTDGFVLTAVEKINRDKISRRDRVTVEQTTATHLFTISTSQSYSLRDVSIELKKQIPGWAKSSNCLDDTDIKGIPDKTFGLLKLLEGVYDAYITFNSKQGSFFSITVNLKN